MCNMFWSKGVEFSSDALDMPHQHPATTDVPINNCDQTTIINAHITTVNVILAASEMSHTTADVTWDV